VESGAIVRALLIRIKWAILMIVALLAIAFVGLVVYKAFLIATMLPFIGSSGAAYEEFMRPVIPLGYFVEGAYLCGGAVALVNAIATPRHFWVKSIAMSAVVGGSIAAITPNLGHRLTGLAEPAFVAIRTLDDYLMYPNKANEEREGRLAALFVQNEGTVIKTVGADFEAASLYSPRLEGGRVQYDIWMKFETGTHAQRGLFAVVDVSRSKGNIKFSLECITALGPFDRDNSKDPCKQ
jgi:hypothetical protein